MSYLGDIRLGETLDFKFTTRRFTTGAPFTLAGTPSVGAYLGNSAAELTGGITLTPDFDGKTGLNHVRVVASNANGYGANTNVMLVLLAGTVDGVSVVGEVVGSFSIEARSALRPTTAGRTLEVSAAGAVTSSSVVDQGTAQAATATTLRLRAAAAFADDEMIGNLLLITGATAGAGQVRQITDYEAATDTATVDPWVTTPTGTITYQVLPFRMLTPSAGAADVNVVAWRGITLPTSDTPGYPVVTIKEGIGPGELLLDAGAVQEVQTVSGTVAQPVDVTPEALSGVKTQVVAALASDLYGESTAVPPANASLATKIRWLTTVARNKILQTATGQRVRNDGDTADLASSTVGDDGTTFTRGKWS